LRPRRCLAARQECRVQRPESGLGVAGLTVHNGQCLSFLVLGHDHATCGGPRIVAGLFAALLALLGFGTIELEAAVEPTSEWLPVAVLDGGWVCSSPSSSPAGSHLRLFARRGPWRSRCNCWASWRSSRSPALSLGSRRFGACWWRSSYPLPFCFSSRAAAL